MEFKAVNRRRNSANRNDINESLGRSVTNTMRFKSIQIRLLAFFVPLFVIGNAFLSLFLYFSFSNTLTFNAQQRLSAMASDYMHQVESAINSRLSQLQLLADSPVFRFPDDRDQVVDAMENAFQVLGTFDTILYISCNPEKIYLVI